MINVVRRRKTYTQPRSAVWPGTFKSRFVRLLKDTLYFNFFGVDFWLPIDEQILKITMNLEI